MLRSLVVREQTWRSQLISHLRQPLYRNGYALVFNGLATSGLGLVYWVLAARLYPAEMVGLNSAILAAMQLVASVALLSSNTILVRFIPTAGSRTPRLIAGAYGLAVVVALLTGLGFVLGARQWIPAFHFTDAPPVWSVVFVLSVAMWCIFILQDSALTGLRQAIWVPVENVSFSILKMALLFLLVKASLTYSIWLSWLVPLALSLLPVNLLVFSYLVPRHVRDTEAQALPMKLGPIVKYGSGSYVGTLFLTAATNLLPILVASLAGAAANAYFSQPWLIYGGMQLVAANMSLSLIVEGTLDAGNLHTFGRRVLIQVMRFLLPLVAVFWLGAPYILRIFGPSYAAQGSWLLRWLALAVIPHALAALGLGLARAQNRPGVIALVQGAHCILGLGLSYVLLPTYGITGVGIGTLISQTVVALALMVTVLRPVLSGITLQPARE